jgi:hypothetical protein
MAGAAAAAGLLFAAGAGAVSLAGFVGRGGNPSGVAFAVFFEAASAAAEASDPSDAGDDDDAPFVVPEFDAD